MVALHSDESPMSIALRLIHEYGLHEFGPPVDLRPLNELFVPVSTSDPALTDMVVMPSGGVAVSTRSPAHIVMTRYHHLPSNTRYAHEIGHAICRHSGSIPLMRVDDWFHERQEREAWQIAAVLLIPRRVIYEGGFDEWTMSDIAAACDVPLWLVEMYPR